MAYVSQTDRRVELRAQIDRFFAALGQGFNAYLLARSRAEAFERLNAMSDEQLASMGLTRDRIVHHVFADKFGL